MKGLFSRFSRENLLPRTSRNTWLTRELLAAVLFRAGDAELQGRVLKAASLPSVTANSEHQGPEGYSFHLNSGTKAPSIGHQPRRDVQKAAGGR